MLLWRPYVCRTPRLCWVGRRAWQSSCICVVMSVIELISVWGLCTSQSIGIIKKNLTLFYTRNMTSQQRPLRLVCCVSTILWPWAALNFATTSTCRATRSDGSQRWGGLRGDRCVALLLPLQFGSPLAMRFNLRIHCGEESTCIHHSMLTWITRRATSSIVSWYLFEMQCGHFDNYHHWVIICGRLMAAFW